MDSMQDVDLAKRIEDDHGEAAAASARRLGVGGVAAPPHPGGIGGVHENKR